MAKLHTMPPMLYATATDPMAWQVSGDGYAFKPCETVQAMIMPDGTGWKMDGRIYGKHYTGTRGTLREAFIAMDRLLYEQAKDLWLKSKCTVVLQPWQGDLNA